MTLITPYEVIANAPVSRDYPTQHLCILLPQIEESFARECLGKELYDFLLSKKNAYPETVTAYTIGASYQTGDAVVVDGCTYIAKSNGVTSNPLVNTTDWDKHLKFSDAGANELWDRYLRLILALKGYISTVVPNTYRSTAGGLIVNDGDSTGNRAARKAELSDIKNHTLTEIERVTKNMEVWLNENAATKNLPWKVGACEGGNCATPGKRVRRWGFR